jgi:hypothetical protein
LIRYTVDQIYNPWSAVVTLDFRPSAFGRHCFGTAYGLNAVAPPSGVSSLGNPSLNDASADRANRARSAGAAHAP